MASKVKAMGRIGKIYHVLKEENEVLLKMKQMAPDGKLPKGLLLDGRPAIQNAFKNFKVAKELDQINEKRPKTPSKAVGKKK
jgi:serine/threonine-protein phosphatase 2B catalytic subunit